MQKQDFGQLNIMPRHTCRKKGYDSTHRRVITTQQVKTASEGMLQGVVKEVSACPLSVNELAASVEEVSVTSREADGLSALTTWTLTLAAAIHIVYFALPGPNAVCPSSGQRTVQVLGSFNPLCPFLRLIARAGAV